MRLFVVPLLALAAPLDAQFNAPWVAFQEDASLLSTAGPLADDQNEVDVDWGDLDGDGWIDVVVVRKEPFLAAGPRTNVLLMNEGGVLTDRTAPLAVDSDVPGGQGFLDTTPDRDVVLVDVDNDGFLDVVTATDQSAGLPKDRSHPRVYVNQGIGGGGSWSGLRHEDARVPELLHAVSGLPKPPKFTSVDAGDLDVDGWADLYFGDQNQDPDTTFQPESEDLDDRVLINQQNGFFLDQSTLVMPPPMLASPFTNSVEVADFNLDGADDVLKQTSFTFPNINATVRYNDPATPGVFASQAIAYTGLPYFVESGDLNRDGRMDVVVSDNQDDVFLLNEATLPGGAVQWGSPQTYDFLTGGDDGFGSNSLVVDLDLDGWNDVLVTDVDPQVAGYTRRTHVYHNRGGAVGGNVELGEERASKSDTDWIGAIGLSEDKLGATHDVAVFDIDNDGLQDLLLFRYQANDAYRGVAPLFCQTDLGFGIGAPVLEICGGDLSSGNDATLRVFNGPPATPGILALSTSAIPVTVPGVPGTVLTLPAVYLQGFATDGQGAFSQPVPGGGGPVSFVVQVAVLDPKGLWRVSNGIQAQFLP